MKGVRCLTLALMSFIGGQIGFNLRRYVYANVPPGGPQGSSLGAPDEVRSVEGLARACAEGIEVGQSETEG